MSEIEMLQQLSMRGTGPGCPFDIRKREMLISPPA